MILIILSCSHLPQRLFGNPGQASYTAANGYLDGLARARAAAGLKATSVAWGAISDVGVLTRQKDTAESLARHTGDVEFKARDGLNLLARILVRDDCNTSCNNITLATMNWSMAADMLEIIQTPAYDLIRREAKIQAIAIAASKSTSVQPFRSRR